MKVVTTIAEARNHAKKGRRVLVPTMGALHKAHRELIRGARAKGGNDGEVVVSIFVNPLQFEPGSDYERYPRPGHFRGVCTVVAKLFNILKPDAAVFGEKDFQQLAIIRRMVRDLNYKIDIVAVPTVREADGLAYSSRNAYLNAEERKQAAVLRKALLAAKDSEKKTVNEIVGFTQEIIGAAPLARIDYVELVDAETLQPIEFVQPNSLLALAVYFGKTRLIDNILLE